MHKSFTFRARLIGAAALTVGLAMPAAATTVTDPVGDFLPTFTGDHDPDLDVTSFSVNFDSVTSSFLLQATLDGDIDPAKDGLYAIGVNTGTGAAAPFGDIGAPNVIFDQVIAVQKDGTGLVTGPAGGPLGAGEVTVGGNAFSLIVPLALLPTTGFDPLHYGFNLWPRSGFDSNAQVSDFSPDDATVSVAGAVPEPASWMTLIAGFGLLGSALRGRRGRMSAVPA